MVRGRKGGKSREERRQIEGGRNGRKKQYVRIYRKRRIIYDQGNSTI